MEVSGSSPLLTKDRSPIGLAKEIGFEAVDYIGAKMNLVPK